MLNKITFFNIISLTFNFPFGMIKVTNKMYNLNDWIKNGKQCFY